MSAATSSTFTKGTPFNIEMDEIHKLNSLVAC